MAHPHHKEAKDGHAKKLASFGGKSKGTTFSDTGTYDGVPPVDSGKVNQPQKIPTRKAGGRVGGDHAAKRLDKAPRAKKAMGGPMMGAPGVGVPMAPGAMPMRAKGGKVHPDEAEDKKLISKMIKSDDKRHERADGGRVGKGKGKTTVNVIVSPQGGGQQPPQRVPVPVPVPQGPPPGAGAPPPGGMPPGGPPPMGGGAMPPPGMMGRKAGGRVSGPEGDSFCKGSGGENVTKAVREKYGNNGLGRLEKLKRQGGSVYTKPTGQNY